MNDEFIEKFVTGIFTQGSAILKIKYYNLKNLIVEHLPVREREKKNESFRVRNGYIIDHRSSVDFQEIIKIGGRLIEIYEGVIYRENFKVCPFRKMIDKLFSLRQKYKDEKNEVMHLLVKLMMETFYGEQIRKDIEKNLLVRSEYQMMSECDERVKDYWKICQGNYIIKMFDDTGLENEDEKLNTMPSQLGAFVLGNSKGNMDTFIQDINAF